MCTPISPPPNLKVAPGSLVDHEQTKFNCAHTISGQLTHFHFIEPAQLVYSIDVRAINKRSHFFVRTANRVFSVATRNDDDPF